MRFSHFLCLPLAAIWSLTVCPTVTGSTRNQSAPRKVREREGQTALLDCDPPVEREDQTTQVIEWLREGLVLPIFIKYGLHPPRIDGAYLDRLRLVEGASLRVESLHAEDEGWYQCRVLYLTQPYEASNGSWIYLSVTTPPSFQRTPPPSVEIRQGEAAHLRCDAQGRPKPLISWSKDGGELDLQSGQTEGPRYQVTNGSLKIQPVDRTSAGVYTCEARSEEGSVTHSTRLLVRGPPTIILPPHNVTVNYTQDTFFSCQAEAYPTNLTYSWFKDGENVHHLSGLRHRASILTDGSLLLRETWPQDAGHYTCVPSNGLAVPPEASADLRVLHPAYVQSMPSLTVLAVGMRGRIPCPSVANPPLLYTNWTKNGAALQLDKIPGWYLDGDGTIVIAVGTDDALGDYCCTPYNSYGTLGESSPTHVILKDPPRFVKRPAERYLQDVGRELSISCLATGDPEPVVSWSKEGSSTRGRFQVLEDGTLFFRSVRKEHHGRWSCEARNNVTHITTWTTVLVMGTSPHAPTHVTVKAGLFAVNVSWEPGFDGGCPQRFTVWFRQMTHGPHDWIIRKVPASASSLLVEDLWPGTSYQFSVLAQSDWGSGPFSQIITVQTLSIPVTTAAPPQPTATEWTRLLLPPRGLTANRTARGIVLCWDPPPLPSRLPLGYVLEFREAGGWAVLHSAIPAQQDQLLLSGLIKDTFYQFRLSSLSEELISEPSDAVNVSTSDMSIYPSRRHNWAPLSRPVRAGIIAGSCFLLSALVISAVVSCITKHRRARRMHGAPIIYSRYQKTPNLVRSDSPDSLLKLKWEPSLEETYEQVTVFPRSSGGEKFAQYETHLGCLESIQRGPDGRFVVQSKGRPGAPLQDPCFESYPRPSQPEACPQPRVVRPEPPLRSKFRGQAQGRPRACYFALASSSPADGTQPPRVPDLSPIPRLPAPEARPGPSAGFKPVPGPLGLSPRPSCSLLELGPVAMGDGGLSHGLSCPGPLETSPPGLQTLGPAVGPTWAGPSGGTRSSGLPGGRGAASNTGLGIQASRNHCTQAGVPHDLPRFGDLLHRESTGWHPSLAPLEVPGGSPAPNSSGYHSGDVSRRASRERSHDKRDIPADENYEWDAGLAMGSEILEALRLYKRERRPTSSLALQDLELTAAAELKRSGTVQSLEAPGPPRKLRQTRPSTESRCAALREEFQEYRRRKEREKEERAPRKGVSCDGRFEQATLL